MEFARQTLSDLKEEAPFNRAETRLLKACGQQAGVRLGATRPKLSSPSNSVRASLIRYLLLGGCSEQRADVRGVNIQGAMILGRLDLRDCHTSLSLSLTKCTFEEGALLANCDLGLVRIVDCFIPTINAVRGRFKSDLDFSETKFGGEVAMPFAKIEGLLNFSGSKIDKGLVAIGSYVRGAVLLRNEFLAKGRVRFVSAEIKGQFSCVNGTFLGGLNCNGAVVGGAVFLRDGFVSKGDVDFRGANIGKSVYCSRAKMQKSISFSDATIKGRLAWVGLTKSPKTVNLAGLTLGTLDDDWKSWAEVDHISLEGFSYEALARRDASFPEIEWLSRGSPPNIIDTLEVEWRPRNWGTVVNPKPYTQLAEVLAKSGEKRKAANILVVRDQKLALAEWARLKSLANGDLRNAMASIAGDLQRPFTLLFGLIAGYGHRPVRSVIWALGVILFSICYFQFTYQAGQMAPNSDVILASADWKLAVDKSCDPQETPEDGCKWPAQVWTSPEHNSSVAKDYETFSAIGYGFDLFIPLDALGQETTWAPSYSRGWWGAIGFYLRWVIQTMGWVITAIGAATLTGLIGRKS